MIRKIIKGSLSAVFIVLLTGCATIMSGSYQKILIKSSPSDAKVTVYTSENAVATGKDGKSLENLTTPTVVKLERDSVGKYFDRPPSYIVEISKEGYDTQRITLKARVNGWYIVGNFFYFNMIGYLIVDPLTGAMWSLRPRTVKVDLSKTVAERLDYQKGDLVVILKQNLDEKTFDQLPLVSLMD